MTSLSRTSKLQRPDPETPPPGAKKTVPSGMVVAKFTFLLQIGRRRVGKECRCQTWALPIYIAVSYIQTAAPRPGDSAAGRQEDCTVRHGCRKIYILAAQVDPLSWRERFSVNAKNLPH